jgi:hypothetical protein
MDASAARARRIVVRIWEPSAGGDRESRATPACIARNEARPAAVVIRSFRASGAPFRRINAAGLASFRAMQAGVAREELDVRAFEGNRDTRH